MIVQPITCDIVEEIAAITDETGVGPWTAESYRLEIERTDSVNFCAWLDGILAGFAIGRVVVASNPDIGYEAELYNIAVRPVFRKRGIGTGLLQAFVAKCGKRSVSNIWLEVRKANEGAIAFYSKSGFSLASVRPRFYSDPVDDALLLKLDMTERR